MNEYEERQLEKAEKYEERAKRVKAQSDATLKQVRAERGAIPLGQPILVGHHSEKRHRNHLNRLNQREERGWEESDKAAHYDEKATRIRGNLETNRVISSDDPDAIEKLTAKIINLEDQRTRIKDFNKKARAEDTDPAPAYLLKNLAGNIRSVKKRIANLERREEIDDSDMIVNGITVSKDKDDNRIRLIFPGKPSLEIRKLLKSRGFRWSPSNNAWQRHLNSAGIYAADQVLEKIGDIGND